MISLSAGSSDCWVVLVFPRFFIFSLQSPKISIQKKSRRRSRFFIFYLFYMENVYIERGYTPFLREGEGEGGKGGKEIRGSWKESGRGRREEERRERKKRIGKE
jgi:hypothetical protein